MASEVALSNKRALHNFCQWTSAVCISTRTPPVAFFCGQRSQMDANKNQIRWPKFSSIATLTEIHKHGLFFAPRKIYFARMHFDYTRASIVVHFDSIYGRVHDQP